MRNWEVFMRWYFKFGYKLDMNNQQMLDTMLDIRRCHFNPELLVSNNVLRLFRNRRPFGEFSCE